MNRYGATSRPRPEAVHFSSSTASSVSDYAFAALDGCAARCWSTRCFGGRSLSARQRAALADAVRREILGVLTLPPTRPTSMLAPSGTDTELIAVHLALAARAASRQHPHRPGRDRPRGQDRRRGRYFQEGTACREERRRSGAAADIEVSSVAARDEAGRPLPRATVDAAIGRDARKRA